MHRKPCFSDCSFFILSILFFSSISISSPDSVYIGAEICHVIVFGHAAERWIDSPEHSWFYSGAVVGVVEDTMYVATSIHSSGIFDMKRGIRIGSTPNMYSLYVNFSTGLLLPVQRMALDIPSKLLFLKLYVGDILTEGYDYVLLDHSIDLTAGSVLYIAYFRPGDGRCRYELPIVNRLAGSGNSDMWNFQNEYILAAYPYSEYNNGSPVFYHDSEANAYHLQGLLYLRETNNGVDNVVFPIPNMRYIEDLDWKRVSYSRIAEVRDLRLLPL